MSIQRWSDQIWIAKLTADPGLAEDIDALHSQATGSNASPDVVLDLSAVEHLNSSHLSKLLSLRKALVTADRQLRLAGPSDAIWAIFLATGLDKVFEFSADTMTALAELQLDASN